VCLSCFLNQTTFIDMTNPFEILEARLINIERLLMDLKQFQEEQIAQKKSEELLSVKEAASLLNVAVQTMYGYVQRREIPVSKRSKRLYFSKQELMDWVKEGKQRTRYEIQQQANFRINRRRI